MIVPGIRKTTRLPAIPAMPRIRDSVRFFINAAARNRTKRITAVMTAPYCASASLRKEAANRKTRPPCYGCMAADMRWDFLNNASCSRTGWCLIPIP